MYGKLEKFEEDHEDAEYFMLDGSHRTTALNLGNCEIKATEYENDEDKNSKQQSYILYSIYSKYVKTYRPASKG